MPATHHDVIVLGAGLTGAGVALELAQRGVPAALVDQDPVPVHRASLRNEGKIHLGFIYAHDASRRTAFLQLDGALRFRAILSRWLDGDGWLERSTPFHYLVAADSLSAPGDLAAHYDAVARRCAEAFAADPGLDYLGERPRDLFRRLETREIAERFTASRFRAGFATAERAVNTDRMAAAVRAAVAANPLVTFLPSRTVRSLATDAGGFVVAGDGAGGPWELRAGQVVNATWERRFALDRLLGIEPPPQLLHRLKYRVLARVPAELAGAPSVSMVLGRYGDVVIRPDGVAFLSWYPAGLRGWSHDVEPPPDWNAACRGEVPEEVAAEIRGAIVAAIDAWYPGIAKCSPFQVDAGAIVALGTSDVDDASSGLHDRSRIGVQSRGGYHMIETGKLTTGPMFAVEAANRVAARRTGA